MLSTITFLKKKKVLVNGFFPNMNFGDDLFLYCFKFYSDYKEEDYVVRRNLLSRGFGKFNILKVILFSKKYVWYGGTFIDEDTTLRNLFSFLFEFSYARFFGAEIELLGVGFTPNSSWLKRMVQGYIVFISNRVEVRDVGSFSFAQAFSKRNVVLAHDIVLEYAEKIKEEVLSDRRKNILENMPENFDFLISVDKKKSVGLSSKCKHLCDLAGSASTAVLAVSSPYVQSTQISISKKMLGVIAVGVEIVNADYTTEMDFFCLMKKSSFIVTDRLHVAIAGCILNKKVYLLATTNKLLQASNIINLGGLSVDDLIVVK